ncbi:syncoilin [Parambassis ranga]|uniref:Syncoilin n=1 Tax=Parambassis ranga TaxID=210632 RepID=A0A6P7HSB7_9TELE|nr:syncoilin-like [Parambassis ranga]
MDDLDDNISPPGFEPLFIQEEEGAPGPRDLPDLTFKEKQLKQSVLMKPYLQEMDDLLKSCEELTGFPFGAQYSESYTETSLRESSHTQSKEDISPQAYLSTSYIDTHMDEAVTESRLQSVGTIINRRGAAAGEMPLTSAGKKLSETMVEYEGQLWGMLAMLENCMEESGMDFEPQDWVTDASQEYVQISKNQHRGTTLVPIQQERPLKSETQPMQLETGEEKDASMGKGVLGPTENDPKYYEGGHMFNEGTGGTRGDRTGLDTESPAEEQCELKMDTVDLESGVSELADLGSQMDRCIEEAQQLQKRRRELLMEVLQLRGDNVEGERISEDTEEHIDSKVVKLMSVLNREKEGRREERKREIQSLREERAEEERRMWKVNLERQGLQEELRKLKRMLFAMARDCAHSQANLNTQRREVELLRREEEKLNSLMLQLTEEGCQLRSAHEQQLSVLQADLHAHSSNQASNTHKELTECRRHSCGDIQQYLQGGLRALEDRYEPILLALLKRREAAGSTLVKAKEQAQELRAQVIPLREEIQKLQLQRACLEEKLKLIQIQRREDVEQYKETVYCLEESSRSLKTELNIQKRKTKEMEELRESLSEQLQLYRAAIEGHNLCDHEKT